MERKNKKQQLDKLWEEIDKWIANSQQRDAIEREIWKKWGTDKAIMITDLSSFSHLTREHGIIHFLSIIRLSHSIYLPIIHRFGGTLVKVIADDLVVFFDSSERAVHAAAQMQKANKEYNSRAGEDFKIGLCIGIEFGRVLLLDDIDFYGDTVNISSKLGEDLAGPNEILVGPGAFADYLRQFPDTERLFIKKSADIAQVDFDYYLVDWEKM